MNVYDLFFQGVADGGVKSRCVLALCFIVDVSIVHYFKPDLDMIVGSVRDDKYVRMKLNVLVSC